jgi:hypothetical protein
MIRKGSTINPGVNFDSKTGPVVRQGDLVIYDYWSYIITSIDRFRAGRSRLFSQITYLKQVNRITREFRHGF